MEKNQDIQTPGTINPDIPSIEAAELGKHQQYLLALKIFMRKRYLIATDGIGMRLIAQELSIFSETATMAQSIGLAMNRKEKAFPECLLK